MYRTELLYFVVLTVIILFSQFLPTGLLMILDNVVVRILIVGALLYLISLGPTAGIFGLLAIAIMFLERNRRKVAVAAKKIDLMDVSRPSQATVEEASTPQQTVPVLPFDKPDETETDFLPHETCDSGNFEPVAPTINNKAVLATIYPLNKSGPESGTASDGLYEAMGFGHVRGIKTVDNNLK
jgi:hypothetical protein